MTPGPRALRRAVGLSLLLALAACATPGRQPAVAVAPAEVAKPATAVELGVTPGPAIAELPGWRESDLTPALAAFRRSCAAVQRRADPSGLTTPADWAASCTAATAATDPRAFFETQFTAVQVGDGTGLNTGYFEPEIAGARTAGDGFRTPIYRLPPDLIEVDLGLFNDTMKGRRVRGRVEGQRLVPYHDRAAIEDGALNGRGLELAWAADPVELFFLEIQGSGRLRLPDGSIMRIGYAGQNGRAYTAIGRTLRERGVLAPGQATMDGIIGWIRANPAEGRALMRENRSYVFFRELTGEGPVGALGVAVTPEVTVAVDPAFVPLGAPLWLSTRIPDVPADGVAPPAASRDWAGLKVAQDVGGAIKGANRLDLFWGAGARARQIAGALSSTGRMWLLLPRAVVERGLPGGAPPRP